MSTLAATAQGATNLNIMTSHPRSTFLADQDLLAVVFTNILPDDPTRLSRLELAQGRRQLRDAALTCRSFKDPALDRLWMFLDSLLPLIKILPNVVAIDGVYYFHSSLSQDCNFRRYAHNLRSLELGSPERAGLDDRISPSLYFLVSKSLEGETAFPNLRRIVVHPPNNPSSDIHFTAQLPFAISPSVETAAFYGGGIHRALFADFGLPLVRQQLSCLRHLSLQSQEEQTVSSSCLDDVFRMDALESLELHFPNANVPLERTIYRRQGIILPGLRSLLLDVHTSLLPERTSLNDLLVHRVLFPSLTDLTVVSCSGSRVCSCVPPMLYERVTSLTLTLCTDVSFDTFFQEVLEVAVKIPSLRRLTLEGKGRPIRVMVAAAILRLLELPIEELHVNLSSIRWPYSPFTRELFPSACVKGLLSGSSTIRSLTFPPVPEDDSFTLEYLSDLAHNSVLECMAVGLVSRTEHKTQLFGGGTLTTGDFPTISALLQHWRTNEPPSRSRLRHLAISEHKPLGEFNTQQYNDLAQLLDLMFPQLESITPYRDGERDSPYWKDTWWFIEHLRKMYKHIRVLETLSVLSTRKSTILRLPCLSAGAVSV